MSSASDRNAQAQPAKTLIYSGDPPMANPLRLLSELFTSLRECRYLAFVLFKRNLKGQFRQTLLVYAWLFLPPLATTAVWIFLNQAGVVSIEETSVPYPVYVLFGTLLWQTFYDSIGRPLTSMLINQTMLIKLNFPREALILAGAGEMIFMGVIRLLIIVPVFFVYGINPGLQVLLFPFAFMCLILFGLAIGIWLIPLGLLYGDINRGIQFMGQFLIYTAPVVYPFGDEGWLSWVNRLNPVTYLLETARDTLTAQPLDEWIPCLFMGGGSLVLLGVGLVVLHVAMPHAISRMGM